MTKAEALEKLERLEERLSLADVKVAERGQSAALSFLSGGAVVERTCSTQASAEANLVCLVLWLEDRARNMERGIETFAEAFADSMALAVRGRDVPAQPAGARVSFYSGAKSIDESIAVFRSSFARLGISESEVKVTWDSHANWARLRMRLPSGGIVEKTSKVQKSCEANLAALALWLQSRAKNWERGIESMDLDRVFAGNLLPAKVG